MNKLKEIREKLNIKQKEVAEAINVSKAAYCNYENGKRRINPDVLDKLATYFGVSTDYILERRDGSDIDSHVKNLIQRLVLAGVAREEIEKNLSILSHMPKNILLSVASIIKEIIGVVGM